MPGKHFSTVMLLDISCYFGLVGSSRLRSEMLWVGSGPAKMTRGNTAPAFISIPQICSSFSSVRVLITKQSMSDETVQLSAFGEEFRTEVVTVGRFTSVDERNFLKLANASLT